MNEPPLLASLVDLGDDQICTSETDTDTLNCAMTSALTTRRLRVQAMFGKLWYLSDYKPEDTTEKIHTYMHK